MVRTESAQHEILDGWTCLTRDPEACRQVFLYQIQEQTQPRVTIHLTEVWPSHQVEAREDVRTYVPEQSLEPIPQVELRILYPEGTGYPLLLFHAWISHHIPRDRPEVLDVQVATSFPAPDGAVLTPEICTQFIVEQGDQLDRTTRPSLSLVEILMLMIITGIKEFRNAESGPKIGDRIVTMEIFPSDHQVQPLQIGRPPSGNQVSGGQISASSNPPHRPPL